MILSFIRLVYNLALSPKKTWAVLFAKQETREEFTTHIYFPLLGIITLTSFAGVFINYKSFELEIALKTAIIICISLLAGLYAASWTINKIYQEQFGGEESFDRTFIFAGYCYSPIMLLVSIMQLFPDFFFLDLLYFIIPYLVWEGFQTWYKVEREKEKLFAISLSAILLLSPWILKKAMFLLMPGMRV